MLQQFDLTRSSQNTAFHCVCIAGTQVGEDLVWGRGKGALGALYRRGGERGASFCYMWVIAFIEPQRWQQLFLWHKGGNFLAFRFTNLNNKRCWADEEKQDNSKKEKKDFCPLVKKGMRMKNLISKLFHLNGWSQNQAMSWSIWNWKNLSTM